MKKLNKFLFLALSMVMALSLLTGCSKDSEDSQLTTDNTSVSAKIIELDLTSEEYAFGVDKNQPELLEKTNTFISEIKADGTFDEICNNYFGDGTPVAVKSAVYDPDKDQLVVATNAAFEPFEYMEGDSYYGIDMEIAARLADYLGMELVIQNMDFDAVCLSVGQHKCDIAMAGLTVKEDRKEYVDFSVSYYNAAQKLIVKSNDTSFDDCSSVEEIEAIINSKGSGIKIGVQNGTTGQIYCEGDEDWGFTGFPAETIGYKNGSLAVQDLLNDNIDYVIIDSAPATCITKAINEMQTDSANASFARKLEKFKEIFVEQDGYKMVLRGLKNTLLIAILGLIIGILIGTVIATIRVIPKYKVLPRILNAICSFYVGLFRGTPIVVQLLVFYYVALPILNAHMTGVQVAIWVFGLNSGAYISEIMRSGILSVDAGQMEAGRAVGLSFGTTMVKIVIPQAVKNILPTLGNEFIALIKETSVVSFVGAADLYVAFNYIGSNSYEFMVPYLVMAIIYIVLVLIISLGIKLMERSLRKSDRRN